MAMPLVHARAIHARRPRTGFDRRALRAQPHRTAEIGMRRARSAHSNLGGTMRLGAQRAPVKAGTRAARMYGASVNERHRHRFEVNGRFVPQLEAHGMIISAATPKDQLPEMVELTETLHPWFI